MKIKAVAIRCLVLFVGLLIISYTVNSLLPLGIGVAVTGFFLLLMGPLIED